MSWFKVDDKFHGHAKVKRIPRAVRAEAIGTWLLAGTWSSDHERDGYVPEYMIDELGGTEAGALALVEVGLWRRRRDGFVFVNWAEWQPTREQNDKRREQVRERVRKHRAKSAENPRGSNDDVTRYEDDDTPPPSRPVPTRPQTDNDQSSGELTSSQPDAGRTGSNPVESVDNAGAEWIGADPELARIGARIAELTNRPAPHPLEVAAIRAHYVERAKTPPRQPTAYVLSCLTREDPIVLLNYLDTGRWSS